METHERLDILMDASNPETIYIPRNVAHSVECAPDSDKFILCAYTDLLYNPEDTIPYETK